MLSAIEKEEQQRKQLHFSRIFRHSRQLVAKLLSSLVTVEGVAVAASFG
jgi:hypothetical protein